MDVDDRPQGLPLTHGIEAARELADGQSFASVGGLIGAEALVGAGLGVIGYALLRVLEWQSRAPRDAGERA